MKKIKKSVAGKGEINRNSVINMRNAKAVTTFKNNWQILEKILCVFPEKPAELILYT